MAIYTVKTFNQNKVSIKVNNAGEIVKDEYCTNEKWFVSLPFKVTNLINENGQTYSDSILLPVENFNLTNAKAEVVKKIKVELVRLAEHKEWEIDV